MRASGRRFAWHRLAVLLLILLAEFVVLEAGLRIAGGSEAGASFQALFMTDPDVGHRLRPGATMHYVTQEFETDLAINGQGVRDDAEIGPKAPGEKRILLLGDSLVMSVQVPLSETFGKRLESRLAAAAPSHRWRVINAGVQGYGPVQEWFFFDRVAAAFDPDIVLVVVFVGNDVIEAADAAPAFLAGRPPAPAGGDAAVIGLRRLVRSSMVLQIARIRFDQLRARLTTRTPERPLATYLADPPDEVARGLEVAREAYSRIASRAAARGAATGLVLMPARFQIDDQDFANLAGAVRDAGGVLERQAATDRLARAVAPLQLPTLDLYPALASQPDAANLFFRYNVHLTPRGHEIVANALFAFLRDSPAFGAMLP